MTRKVLFAACVFAALNVCTLSARAEGQVQPQPETYRYGSHLDVRKVVSLSQDEGPECSVVNARMTYLDSRGEQHILAYRKFSDLCHEGN